MNKQVELIKAEVERLWRMCMSDDDYIDAVALDVLSRLKDYINSLQEEPVLHQVKGKEPEGALKELLDHIDEAELDATRKEMMKEEPSICDIVDKHYWEMLGEKPVNELDKLRALSDGKPHLGWLDDAKEEEELAKAAEEYAYTNCEDNNYHEDASEGMPFDPIGHAEKTFIAGADWQRAYTASKAKSKSFEEQVKALWEEQNTGHDYIVVHSYNIFYGLCLDIANWQKEQIEKQNENAMQYVNIVKE